MFFCLSFVPFKCLVTLPNKTWSVCVIKTEIGVLLLLSVILMFSLLRIDTVVGIVDKLPYAGTVLGERCSQVTLFIA